MRIDLYGPAATAIAEDRAAAAPVTKSSVQTPPQDTATLSSGSLSTTSLASLALQSAEARSGKVEALRQAISSGAYTLDPTLIAEAMQGAGI